MILLTGGQDSSETNHVVLKEGFLTQNCAARDPDSPLGFAIFFLWDCKLKQCWSGSGSHSWLCYYFMWDCKLKQSWSGSGSHSWFGQLLPHCHIFWVGLLTQILLVGIRIPFLVCAIVVKRTAIVKLVKGFEQLYQSFMCCTVRLQCTVLYTVGLKVQ